MKKHLHKKGFTLIELLVVIAIIGILASIVLTALGRARAAAADAKAISELNSIHSSMELYYSSKGGYPKLTSGSAACIGIAPCKFADVEYTTLLDTNLVASADPSNPLVAATYNFPKTTTPEFEVGGLKYKGFVYFTCTGGGNTCPAGSVASVGSATSKAAFNEAVGKWGIAATVGGPSCTKSGRTTQLECAEDRSRCSDSAYTDQSSCDGAGSCSDGSSGDRTTCESQVSGGGCTDGSSGTQAICESQIATAASCSDGTSSDPTSCNNNDYCSDPTYTNQGDCEGNGYTWIDNSWTPETYHTWSAITYHTWNPYWIDDGPGVWNP